MDKVLGNEKNQSLLNYFRLKKYPKKLIFLTNKDQIKKQIFSLGTHPEIVELLWYKYAKNFPARNHHSSRSDRNCGRCKSFIETSFPRNRGYRGWWRARCS